MLNDENIEDYLEKMNIASNALNSLIKYVNGLISLYNQEKLKYDESSNDKEKLDSFVNNFTKINNMINKTKNNLNYYYENWFPKVISLSSKKLSDECSKPLSESYVGNVKTEIRETIAVNLISVKFINQKLIVNFSVKVRRYKSTTPIIRDDGYIIKSLNTTTYHTTNTDISNTTEFKSFEFSNNIEGYCDFSNVYDKDIKHGSSIMWGGKEIYVLIISSGSSIRGL